RVDLVVVQRGHHVGEADRDHVDAGSVPTGLVDQVPDGQFHDALERVGRDLLAGQLGRAGDVRVLDDQTAAVSARLAGGGVTGGDHLDRYAVGLGDEHRRGVAEAELVLAGGDPGDDVRATGGGVQLQVDVLLGEEALFLAQVDRGHIDDRDDLGRHLVRGA